MRRKVGRLILGLYFVSVGQAQQPPRIDFVPQGMRIAELVERAVEAHPAVLAARERVAEAEGLRRQAGLRPNPALEIEASTARLLASEDEGGRSVGISQAFELSGKRRRRVEVADAGVEIARAEAADVERRLRAETATACVEVIGTRHELSVRDRQRATLREFVRLTEARAREGEIAPLEAELTKVEVSRHEAQRALAQARLDRSLAELERLIPRELGPVTLSDEVATGELLVSASDLRDRALTERPDLRAARLRAQQANAQVRLASAQSMPDLVGSVRYVRDVEVLENLLGPGQRFRDRDNLLAFGISVPLPFRNRNQGAIQAAAAAERARRQDVAALSAEISRDVTGPYASFRAAERAGQIFRSEVVGKSQRNLGVIREAYRLGQLRLLDVLNEQRKTFDFEVNLVEAERELNLSAVALEAAVGRSLGLLR